MRVFGLCTLIFCGSLKNLSTKIKVQSPRPKHQNPSPKFSNHTRQALFVKRLESKPLIKRARFRILKMHGHIDPLY